VKTFLLFSICILALAVTAFAAVKPSDASLKGTYGFNNAKAETDSWFAQVSCPNYSGQLYAGSETSTVVNDGTITFDGKGNFTYTGDKYGVFDQTLSNETVQWTCDQNGNPIITNPGNAVYDAPVAESVSGTYTVNSDYTGEMNTGGGNSTLILRIAGTNAKGLATTVFLHELRSSNNESRGDGLAIKQ